HHDEGDENTAVIPMIEILLVILTFFIVTYASAGQFPVPTPPVADAQAAGAHPVRIVVDIEGKTTVDGHSYQGQELQDFLTTIKPVSVLIIADKRTPFENVMAVRVFCVKAGVAKLHEGVQKP